jgi:hemoglobin/transferrin/lactoferrin receptor protein
MCNISIEIRKYTCLFLLATGFHLVHAQSKTDSSFQSKELDEIVVSGSKFAEKKKNIVQRIDIIHAKTIAKYNAQNMGDLLASSGNVFVQKSQQGGSSPVIRGFEASRVLLIVDGVRMNNLIYRSGHLQNIITVDQNMLERVEILNGPASTLYGSDALGGAVHMISKKPILAVDTNQSIFKANAFARYSSANREQTLHADINWGGKKFASLTSFTYSDFGDVSIGSNDKKGFENFGTRPFYIQPYSTEKPYDTIIRNPNPRIQKFTGYKQFDFTQKILYQPSESINHTFNIQLSGSSEVPRYDRLQDIKSGVLRFASWYYGPQERKLISYQLNIKSKKGPFEEYKATASYQDIEESRITREYKRYDRLDTRLERVKVAGLIIDAVKKFNKDEITTGIDLQANGLTSTASRKNMLTNEFSKLDTRYPDGKNTMHYAAVYVQHIHKFIPNKLILNDGLRAQFVSLRSSILDNSFFRLPVTEANQDNSSLTGNIGIAYHPGTKTSVKLGYASGFRVPNIDDLSKIFESNTAARQVVIPNTNIKPEYTNSLDLSFQQRISNFAILEGSLYYTQFSNAIVKAPFQLNGQDSIDYYGIRAGVMANQNVNRASIRGLNLMMTIQFNKQLSLLGSFNTIKGAFKMNSNNPSTVYELQSNNTYALVKRNVSSKPLDHIPPNYGKISIQYESKRLFAEMFMMYNGWKKLDQYNPDGEDNAQYATPVGSPSWQTLNLRMAYDINPKVKIQFALENMLDINYRFFASGFSAPGRNAVVSFRSTL